MRRQIYFIAIFCLVNNVCSRAQNPFSMMNSQSMEWLSSSFYLLTPKASSMGVVYQSQYYRQQLSQFDSYAFYGQFHKQINTKDRFGIQLVGFQDIDINANKSVSMNVGGSYQKTLSRRQSLWQHILGAGFQLGFGRKSIDMDNLWFTNQFDVQKEIIQFDWDSGESQDIGDYTSTNFIPLHFAMHYQVLYETIKLRWAFSVRNINKPTFRFGDYEDQLNRAYFGHVDAQFSLFKELKNRFWMSAGSEHLSKYFQVGNGILIADEFHEDWSIFLSVFGNFSPLAQKVSWVQLGTSFNLNWKEFGFQFRYLFPTQKAYHLGNTLQIGFMFIPTWE